MNGEFVVNPSYDERLESKLNITVVATKDGVVMIESGACRCERGYGGRCHRIRSQRSQEDLRRH